MRKLFVGTFFFFCWSVGRCRYGGFFFERNPNSHTMRRNYFVTFFLNCVVVLFCGGVFFVCVSSAVHIPRSSCVSCEGCVRVRVRSECCVVLY